MDWITIGTLITAISAFGATVFAYLSVKNLRKQVEVHESKLDQERKFRKMEIHSRLVNQGREIQSRLPNNVNDTNYEPSENDIRQINMFWYHIFDEWSICYDNESELRELWDRYYSQGVKSALKIKTFREGIENLLKTSDLFGKSDQFYEEINRLCKESTGNNLWRETS
jgi:hypothetical protein